MAETCDKTAQQHLSLADAYYADENYKDAVDSYAAGLTVIRESESLLKFRILSHRSGAFYHLERYMDAVEDAVEASQVLKSTTDTSGLLRGESEACLRKEGQAALAAHLYEQALKAFQAALQLAILNHRDTTAYQDWIRQCQEHLKKKAAAEAAAAAAAAPPPRRQQPPAAAGEVVDLADSDSDDDDVCIVDEVQTALFARSQRHEEQMALSARSKRQRVA